jgi:toxin ParE1/3/4
MANYRIAPPAEAELLHIYVRTHARFGPYQADAYHAGFERIFGLLAQFPRMGISADELAPGFRRFQFQAHSIFYTEEADHVLIRALFHISHDIRPQLFR